MEGHAHDWIWDRLNSYLQDNELKQTNQRKIIVDHFLLLNPHVEADQLYESVKKEGHHIGLATIYRTLNLLKDAGLVTQNMFTDGRSVFELIHPGDHHDHMICLRCGTIKEFENDLIEQTQIQVAEKLGFRLTHHRMDLYGYCAECQN